MYSRDELLDVAAPFSRQISRAGVESALKFWGNQTNVNLHPVALDAIY